MTNQVTTDQVTDDPTLADPADLATGALATGDQTTGRRDRLKNVVAVAVVIITVLLGFWTIRHVNAAHSGPLGLLTILPLGYFAAIAVLHLSFVANLRRSRPSVLVLTVHLVGLVLLLHGAAPFIEKAARFSTAYIHAGFAEYIGRTGHSLPSLDARMSWPSFFALTAVLTKVAGRSSAIVFLQWAPVFFNFTYLAPIYAIIKSLTADRRLPWLGLWLFVTINWIGQDYFAPQAINFLLFCVFTAVFIRFFVTRNGLYPRVLVAIARPFSYLARIGGKKLLAKNQATNQATNQGAEGGEEPTVTLVQPRWLVIPALLVLYIASVVSHQLTPFFAILFVTALVILRRTHQRGLPLVMVVTVVAWISFQTVAYWSGHASDLFGGLGKVSSAVNQNVTAHTQVSTSHIEVIYGRLGLAAFVWLLACLGALRRYRRGWFEAIALTGFIMPFLVLGGQSYGGEAILRVYLFGSPFVAALIAFALLPTAKARLGLVRSGVVVALLLVLTPLFVLTRYGNESFEYISRNEVAGINRLYAIAPQGSRLVSLDASIPWRYEYTESFDYAAPLAVDKVDNLDAIEEEMSTTDHKSFLIITRSQVADVVLTQLGKSPRWADDLSNRLIASGKFHLLYQNPDARIFELSNPPQP